MGKSIPNDMGDGAQQQGEQHEDNVAQVPGGQLQWWQAYEDGLWQQGQERRFDQEMVKPKNTKTCRQAKRK